jgi:ABC-type lipoprotein release transport system permease subunit
VYIVSQGTGDSSINDTLVRALEAEPWADLVSPEILALGTIEGRAVVARAADPFTFVEMEGGEWVEAAVPSEGWAFLGEGLAQRVGVGSGTLVSLVGSMIPRIDVVRVLGIFRTGTVANDELVIDFDQGRFLTGVGRSQYHSIRVKTPNPTSLLAFLDGFGASVHVSGPNLARADIHSDPPSSDRFANLLLRTGQGQVPRDFLATAMTDATASVRVVTLGTVVLIGLLVGFGIDAVQARAFEDKRRSVGILRALGSSSGWVRRTMVRETLPPALTAALVGAALGFVLQFLVQPGRALVVFGHALTPVLDVWTFAGIVGATAAISVVSALRLLQTALREHPDESIRERPARDQPASIEGVLRG